MAKPSIFSKNYQKRMRQRRIRITISILMLIIIVVLTSFYLKGNKNSTNNITKNKNTNTDTSNKKQTDSVKNTSASGNKQKPVDSVEQGFDITVSDSKKVKAIYEVKDNDKKFKYINPTDESVDFSISYSGKAMVIFDKKSQITQYVNVDGTIIDITNEKYISSNNNVYERDATLKNKPTYIWASSPVFIDEENVAYISQLPWFGKTAKYIWIMNIKTKSALQVQGISGENIKFDKTTDRGLTTNVDDKTIFLKSDRSFSQ